MREQKISFLKPNSDLQLFKDQHPGVEVDIKMCQGLRVAYSAQLPSDNDGGFIVHSFNRYGDKVSANTWQRNPNFDFDEVVRRTKNVQH